MEILVGGGYHPPLSGSHQFDPAETENPQITPASHLFAAINGTMSLSTVFDQIDIFIPGYIFYRIHFRDRAADVNCDNCF